MGGIAGGRSEGIYNQEAGIVSIFFLISCRTERYCHRTRLVLACRLPAKRVLPLAFVTEIILSAGDNSNFIAVFVTAASQDDAARIARALVEERLAACGNVLGPVRSIYRWQGEVHDEPEVLLVLKTRAGLFESLRRRVAELHTYDVPEIIALPIEAGHGPYLDWILQNTSS